MKFSHQNAHLAYNQEVKVPQVSNQLEKQLLNFSHTHSIPIQQETKLMKDITDAQQRMPAQLYAVITEMLRLIEKIDKK